MINHLVTDVKTAAVVAATTTGTGLGTILDLIPDSIGKLATLVGIFLSLTLLYTHLRRSSNDSKIKNLEFEILRQKEKERRQAVADRMSKGKAVDRVVDKL